MNNLTKIILIVFVVFLLLNYSCGNNKEKYANPIDVISRDCKKLCNDQSNNPRNCWVNCIDCTGLMSERTLSRLNENQLENSMSGKCLKCMEEIDNGFTYFDKNQKINLKNSCKSMFEQNL